MGNDDKVSMDGEDDRYKDYVQCSDDDETSCEPGARQHVVFIRSFPI